MCLNPAEVLATTFEEDPLGDANPIEDVELSEDGFGSSRPGGLNGGQISSAFGFSLGVHAALLALVMLMSYFSVRPCIPEATFVTVTIFEMAGSAGGPGGGSGGQGSASSGGCAQAHLSHRVWEAPARKRHKRLCRRPSRLRTQRIRKVNSARKSNARTSPSRISRPGGNARRPPTKRRILSRHGQSPQAARMTLYRYRRTLPLARAAVISAGTIPAATFLRQDSEPVRGAEDQVEGLVQVRVSSISGRLTHPRPRYEKSGRNFHWRRGEWAFPAEWSSGFSSRPMERLPKRVL